MLKLYTHPLSTFSRRVEIALREKAIEAERVVVDMAKREHRGAPYLSLHPYGRVPCLVDEAFVLPESTPILEYLEAKFPEPALVPSGLQDRALVSLHMKLCDLEFTSPNYSLIFSKRFIPKEKWRTQEMASGKAQTARHLSILDKHLQDKQYLVAERFTLADLCYIPFLHFIDLLEVDVPANVRRWSDQLLSRPSAQATTPAM